MKEKMAANSDSPDKGAVSTAQTTVPAEPSVYGDSLEAEKLPRNFGFPV
jgi:hypothetical protein